MIRISEKLRNFVSLAKLVGVKNAVVFATTRRRITFIEPETKTKLTFRGRSTDFVTFRQIFFSRQYDFPGLPRTAKTIVDLGANIGLSAVFFAHRYPQAKIVAVEPDGENFDMLLNNCSSISNVTVCRRAIMGGQGWAASYDGGNKLEENAIVFQEVSGQEVCKTSVPCTSLVRFLDDNAISHVDVLKIDVEGAEAVIFRNAKDWIHRCDVILVEPHDDQIPGVSAFIKETCMKHGYRCKAFGEGFAIVKSLNGIG